jgi:serine/threonine protein kinase
MTAERWQQVKTLFETAREAPAAERERLLTESGDLELAREVRALLQAYDESGEFLEDSALESGAALVADRIPSPMLGVRVGAYRITRQVGEGGMGVVYEAERADGQFHQRVAIKILRTWKMSGVDISRFRAERQILASLDHPHIARLLDGGSTADGLPFYAMEFVEGRYLDDFCRELPVEERLKLMRKVCDAVEYAHQRAIIHRDLKPANILVTKDGSPKLLDFGIAKVLEAEGARTLTLTSNRAATPYYASPEQLQGGTITCATDIYSLGVLLYELLSGAHPHRTSSDAIHVVTAAICEQDPEPPSKRVESPAWTRDLDRVVLKAMSRNPAERYASAAELSDEIGRYLDRQPVRARTGSLRRDVSRTFRRRWPAIAAAAAVVAFAVALAWSKWAPAPTRAPRRSLAVMGFQNLSGRPDASWIATAVAEMLATDLASSERIRVVSADTVNRVKSELSVPDSPEERREVIDRLRTNLGVDYFVTGSYFAPPEGTDSTMRLFVRLQDAHTGQILAGASETGTAAQLPSLVSDAIGELLRNREWSDVARTRSARALALFRNPDSARLYAQGLEQMRHFDPAGAREPLRRAAEADPSNPLAHSAYSEALRALGYEELAREQSKQAYDLSAALSREDRLLVTARYHETSNEWSQAAADYHALWDLFNDNPEYGLKLARSQSEAGKPADALATLQTLRAMPGGNAGDPRIDLEESYAAGIQSDYNRKLAASTRAYNTAARMNARVLAADASLDQGDALYGLSRLDDSLAAYRVAEATSRDLGDTFGMANIILRQGRLFWSKGDYNSAKGYDERALALFEQIGNKHSVSVALNNLALVTRGHGDLEGGLRMFEQSIAIDREIGDKKGLTAALTNAGNLLRRLNRQDEARRYFEECLAIAAQLNDQEQVARSHITLSLLEIDAGNLVSSLDHVRQALSITERTKNQRLHAVALQNLGDVKLAQADYPGARQAYEDSVGLSRTLKSGQYIADGNLTLAEIAIAQKDFDAAARFLAEARDYYTQQKQKNGLFEAQLMEARLHIAQAKAGGTEQSIEEAAAGFQALHLPARQTASYSFLAQAYLAQRKPAQARQAIARGRAAFEQTHDFQERMRYRVTAARAAGDPQALRSLIAELESKNWSALSAEARAALGER